MPEIIYKLFQIKIWVFLENYFQISNLIKVILKIISQKEIYFIHILTVCINYTNYWFLTKNLTVSMFLVTHL